MWATTSSVIIISAVEKVLTTFVYVSILPCLQLLVWVQYSHIVCHHVAFELFSSLSLAYLAFVAFNNFMQKSVASQNMANPSAFPVPNRVRYCLQVFINFTLLRTSSLATLSGRMTFTILPHIELMKAWQHKVTLEFGVILRLMLIVSQQIGLKPGM